MHVNVRCFVSYCMSVKGERSDHVSAYHTAQFVSPSTCHDCVRVCSAYEGKEDSASRIRASVLRLFIQEFPKPLLAPSVNLGQDSH